MKCKFCGVELEAYHHFDMSSPIGLNIDELPPPRKPNYLWCSKCGLMYQKID